MNNYIDKYSRYHHKPVPVFGEPSSNNGWIYTAYAFHLGMIHTGASWRKLGDCFRLCRPDQDRPQDGYKFLRNPGKETPPISRDEILGLVALGFLQKYHLEKLNSNWNFSPYPLPRFSAVQLIKQLWELRPSVEHVGYDHFSLLARFKIVDHTNVYQLNRKHRNYFWQNNLDQLYRFAFSVPLQDRYFILKCWDKFSGGVHHTLCTQELRL